MLFSSNSVGAVLSVIPQVTTVWQSLNMVVSTVLRPVKTGRSLILDCCPHSNRGRKASCVSAALSCCTTRVCVRERKRVCVCSYERVCMCVRTVNGCLFVWSHTHTEAHGSSNTVKVLVILRAVAVTKVTLLKRIPSNGSCISLRCTRLNKLLSDYMSIPLSLFLSLLLCQAKAFFFNKWENQTTLVI
jgi:hypothetical protein